MLPFPVNVFCCATDNYIPYCIVSLLTFTHHNPEYDPYIIVKDCSKDMESLSTKFGIGIIKINLDDSFHTAWNYPVECYYHFKGPDIFNEMGYRYSVFMDGDIYCNAKYSIKFYKIKGMAGVSYVKCSVIFEYQNEYDKVKKAFGLTDKHLDCDDIQAGVICYNNRNLVELNFFDKMLKLYQKSIDSNIPRKGDDTLISLMIAVHKEIPLFYLPHKYNYINKHRNAPYHGNEHLVHQCICYHLIKHKPWKIYKSYKDYNEKYFTEKWREAMINKFTQLEIFTYFKELYIPNIISDNEVMYFWYKYGNFNFGDWITPYLVKKITGEEAKFIDPHQTKSSVIISTGSIMRVCGSNTIVWGSGIRDIDQNINGGKLIRSVRGPLTRNRLLSIGCECPPIYGDPCLLLPKFYNPVNIQKIYALGIIPHISQYKKVKSMYSEKNTCVIDLTNNDVEYTIDLVLKCKRIVSSSLHGIIVAHAYGLPVRWIKFDDNINGDDTKYYDHYLSVGINDVKFINAMFYKKISVNALLNIIKEEQVKIDLDQLMDASIFNENGTIKQYIKYVLAQ